MGLDSLMSNSELKTLKTVFGFTALQCRTYGTHIAEFNARLLTWLVGTTQ